MKTLEERFWAKVERKGPNDCWPWLGTKRGWGVGYGQFEKRSAPRISWELENKRPFPAGLYACHSCNNPCCVNPKHIYPDTQAGNLRYARELGRILPKDAKTHCIHGHEFSMLNTYTSPQGNRECRICRRSRERKRRIAGACPAASPRAVNPD